MADDLTPATPGNVDGSTRRELVRGAVAAGAAAAMATVAPPLLGPTTALAAAVGDGAVLPFALRAEQIIVYAYEHVLASGVISAATARVLTQFLGQEREHAGALSVSIVRLGDALPAAPSDLATFERELHQLGVKRSPATLRTERDYVSFLIRIEALLATVYRFAIYELADDKLLQTAAQIMANEGQHATVLHELISPGNVQRAVPTAFVGGLK